MSLSSLFTRKKRIVNLTFKDHVIRYAELKQSNPPVILSYGEYLLPPGVIKDGRIIDWDILKQIVDQCVQEWDIPKRQVRFLVPDPFIVIRKTAIPGDINDDEIEGYLYLEIGSSIHLPFEDPIFDMVNLPNNSEKKEIILFAAPENIVNEYNRLLEDCNLHPIAADISSLSMYRYFHMGKVDFMDEHILLLQFDLLTVNASIFVDDKPIFMRHIELPGEFSDWEKTVTTRTGEPELVYTGDKDQYMGLLEDSFTEIDRVRDFYKYSLNRGQEAISKVLVSGDHPFLDKLAVILQEKSDVPVQLVNTTSKVLDTSGEVLPDPYCLVAGLALKGVV